MNILLLFSAIIASSFQSVVKKYYNNKADNKGSYLFNAVAAFAALVFFVFSSGFKLNFTVSVLPYSIVFAVSYGVALLFSFLSIREGSLSISSLAISYSLVIPTLFGLLYYEESVSRFFYPGIVFLALSIFLINTKKGDTKITFKWVIYILLAFVGNGVCSTAQNVQQKMFGGEYKSEFMIIALAFVSAFLFALSFVNEKSDIRPCTKSGIAPMILCGLSNGVCNLLVMALSSKMDASILFPLISAGGIVVTSLVSIFIYKEKMTPKQYCGLILGIAAVVFLNL